MAYPQLCVTFDNKHFAEGRFRRAYKGTYKGPPSKYGQLAVVKESKESYMWKSTDWNVTVDMHKEAQELAEEFNSFSSGSTNYRLKFTDVNVAPVTETSTPDSTPKLNEYCVIEDYIPGQFNKWCNNYGFISAEAKSSHCSMPAFMHWSWWNSNGEKMISDLQGVRSEYPKSYILTDPAMLSLNNSYGVTDMGVEGMAMFFLHHECSSICESLSKPKESDLIGIIPQGQLSATMQQLKNLGNATTYTHELKFPPRVREGITTVFRRVARYGY